MIKSLEISNYALIDKLRIDFGEGLNIITGETGAGKSILLGALSLLMGERAEIRTIRDQSRKTIVEAEFEYSSFPVLEAFLREADIDVLQGICILRREITAKGGSRAFINDTPVNLALMKSVGEMLLDIHSQHQNLLLVDSSFQLEILDALADNHELLERYTSLFNKYKKAIKEYKVTSATIKKSKSEADYISYQLRQLKDLHLKKGEL
ncbi:MAG: AAA family ATPase, partial [Muribaculaceae bacterium]|nr:AAA family ATPase [Muribaculaceae bacterium]